MRRLLLATTAASLLGLPLGAAAGTAQGDGDGPFLQAGETDIFATQIIGIAVLAPRDGEDAVLPEGEGAIDSAELGAFEEVGQVTDVMMAMDGTPRAVVITLGPDAPGAVGDPAAAGAVPGAGIGREIALDIGEVRFFSDANAPHVVFAVSGLGLAEMQEAPLLERPHLALDGTGPVAAPADQPAAQGWMMGRDPMMAPSVAIDGWQQVPVAELSVDDLTDAAVFGAGQEQIGSVNDVHLDADGQIEYVTVDVGGFLGLGTHTFAIGFDEMTVLRDSGWEALQVHVAATRQDLEQMPEYEAN
jgi:hypothetical protein